MKTLPLTTPQATIDDCYKAGYDCGVNGASASNSHFSFFLTEQKVKAWERGKLHGQSNMSEEDGEGERGF